MIGLARSVFEKNPNTYIIVEAHYHQVTQFFELLGIRADRIIVIGHGEDIFVKKLHLTYFMICGLQSVEITRATRKWVRDRHPSLYSSVINKTDIIVLHRSESGCKRCLRNSNEIANGLRVAFPERKVILFVAGSMSVYEQMKIVCNAEVFVAPHGAGLTNLIFLPDGASVVEIHNHPDYISEVYYELSIALDYKYRGIAPKRTSERTVDFSLADIPHVVETVKEVLTI